MDNLQCEKMQEAIDHILFILKKACYFRIEIPEACLEVEREITPPF